MKVRNGCRGCGRDFASVDAFDRHRVGSHLFTYSEGLAFDVPREDGRRCLDADEMLERGMELDANGRWRIVASEAGLAFFEQMRGVAA